MASIAMSIAMSILTKLFRRGAVVVIVIGKSKSSLELRRALLMYTCSLMTSPGKPNASVFVHK